LAPTGRTGATGTGNGKDVAKVRSKALLAGKRSAKCWPALSTETEAPQGRNQPTAGISPAHAGALIDQAKEPYAGPQAKAIPKL